MDVVRFRLRQPDDEDSICVDVFVNDTPLPDLMAKFERRFPGAQRTTGYSGIFTSFFDEPLVVHFTGSPESHGHCGPADKTVLQACACGEPGC